MFEISVNTDGTFADIQLTSSVISEPWAAFSSLNPSPMGVLIGPNRLEEVRAFLSKSPNRRLPLVFMEEGLLNLKTPTVPRSATLNRLMTEAERQSSLLFRIARAATGPSIIDLAAVKFNDVIKAYRDALSVSGANPTGVILFDEYVNRLEEAFDTRGAIFGLEAQFGPRPMIALAVWLRKRRPHPSLVTAGYPVANLPKYAEVIESQTLSLPDVLREIEVRFHLDQEEVATAHRIWALSRRRMYRTLPSAREAITINSARELCEIVSETYQRKIIDAHKPQQRPAPIKFEFTPQFGITLLKSHSAEASAVVIRAAAESLCDTCTRLSANSNLHNQVPNFAYTMERISSLLRIISEDEYDDGHVVALGMEFNALQWQIDGVKANLTEVALAEATGLFANAYLLLSRFPAWKDFAGRESDACSDSDDFDAARALLQHAREAPDLLDTQANRRVSQMLGAPTLDKSPPAIREGVVDTGENLAAVVVSGASDLLVTESRAFGSILKGGAPTEGAKAVVEFAKDHADELAKLALARKAPWAEWGISILRQIKELLA